MDSYRHYVPCIITRHSHQRNEDILEEVGGRQLWNSVVAEKLRNFGHIMTKEDENLEKCIITGTAERYSWERKTAKSLER